MKIHIGLLLALMIVCLPLTSQTFIIDENHEFEIIEDYPGTEKLIIKYIDWLNEMPVDSVPEIRKKVMKYVDDWGKETPAMVIYPQTKVSDGIFKEIEKEYGLDVYMSYYGGMVAYMIEHPEDRNLVQIQQAGVVTLLDFSEKNQPYLDDFKCIRDFHALSKHGALKSWIDHALRRKEKRWFKHFKPSS